MAKKGRRSGHSKGGGARLDKMTLARARQAVDEYPTMTAAGKALGITRQTLMYQYQRALELGITADDVEPEEDLKIVPDGDNLTLHYFGTKIETKDQLLEDADIDLSVWEVVSVDINNWEVGGKAKQGQHRHEDEHEAATKVSYRQLPEKLWKMPLRQIKVKLKRKRDERVALEELIKELRELGPQPKKIKIPAAAKRSRRALEICIMDPHFGLECFPPGADKAWSLEDCHAIAMWAVTELLRLAEPYGPFEEIVFPFGNDFLHHDNLFHTTTAGTPQPEGMPYQYVYRQGINLAIAMVEKMKEVCPVRIYAIPGNHDRQSIFTMGHVLWGYYHRDPNVSIDATEDPYKFWKYGTNLVGFEHGHSVKPIRFAALMANECSGPGNPRKGWFDDTTYREWHVGDQHRKGSSKPSMFEEQGVSIEYLPGLTPPNEWHRLKSYNWQKRGAMAFIWDYETGPSARVQVNLSSYTGRPTGMSAAEYERLFTPS